MANKIVNLGISNNPYQTHGSRVSTTVELGSELNIDDMINKLKNGDTSVLELFKNFSVNYAMDFTDTGYVVKFTYQGSNYEITYIDTEIQSNGTNNNQAEVPADNESTNSTSLQTGVASTETTTSSSNFRQVSAEEIADMKCGLELEIYGNLEQEYGYEKTSIPGLYKRFFTYYIWDPVSQKMLPANNIIQETGKDIYCSAYSAFLGEYANLSPEQLDKFISNLKIEHGIYEDGENSGCYYREDNQNSCYIFCGQGMFSIDIIQDQNCFDEYEKACFAAYTKGYNFTTEKGVFEKDGQFYKFDVASFDFVKFESDNNYEVITEPINENLIQQKFEEETEFTITASDESPYIYTATYTVTGETNMRELYGYKETEIAGIYEADSSETHLRVWNPWTKKFDFWTKDDKNYFNNELTRAVYYAYIQGYNFTHEEGIFEKDGKYYKFNNAYDYEDRGFVEINPDKKPEIITNPLDKDVMIQAYEVVKNSIINNERTWSNVLIYNANTDSLQEASEHSVLYLAYKYGCKSVKYDSISCVAAYNKENILEKDGKYYSTNANACISNEDLRAIKNNPNEVFKYLLKYLKPITLDSTEQSVITNNSEIDDSNNQTNNTDVATELETIEETDVIVTNKETTALRDKKAKQANLHSVNGELGLFISLPNSMNDKTEYYIWNPFENKFELVESSIVKDLNLKNYQQEKVKYYAALLAAQRQGLNYTIDPYACKDDEGNIYKFDLENGIFVKVD